MAVTCSYTHSGGQITEWECPHPATEGSFCPFHTSSAITRTELAEFSEGARRSDDNTVPAVGACAERIPIDASTRPLDLREAETAICATETGSVPGFDLTGATLTQVDLAHTRITGDAMLTDATIEEIHLDQARIEERFTCAGADIGTVTADGARFEMVCDLHDTTITDECRLNEIHVNGVLALTDSEVDCPLFLNRSIVHGNLGIADTVFSGRVLGEHLRVYGACNAAKLTASEVMTFRRSEFGGVVDFSGAEFQSEARFDMNTTFQGEVTFDNVVFRRRARFAGAHFEQQADFNEATFDDVASFAGAQFDEIVAFGQQTVFDERAEFDRVTFDAAAVFDTARITSARFTAAVCADSLSLKNAQTGTVTLTEASLGGLDCRQIACDGRLQLEDAVVDGTIDVSSGAFKQSVVLRGTSITGDLSASNTTFGDELDCRETTVSGTVRLETTEADPRRSSPADSNGTTVEGRVGFTDAVLETLVLDGAALKQSVLAERAHIADATIAPGEGSEATVWLTGTEIRAGTLAPPETGAVRFDLERAVVGNVTLEPGPDATSPLEPYWIVRAEFDGFRFTEHRELLVTEDWELYGSPPGVPLSPTDLELTYLAAKNGANQVGDRNAAGEFFKRELRHRRSNHRNALSRGTLRSRAEAGVAWGANKTLDLTAVYGESPSRVLATATLSIAAFSALSLALDPTSITLSTLVERTLFSIQTFTAFIFGRPEVPTTEPFQWLTAIQAFLGAFLIGLFIFALTRSVSR